MTDPTHPPPPPKRIHRDSPCPVRDSGGSNLKAKPLSPRELEVLRLIMQGRMNKEIARELGIVDRTVEFHVANLFEKMDVQSGTQAAMRGMELGLQLKFVA